MSQKMVKWLSASLVTMGAFIWGCSESDPAPDKIIANDDSSFQKNDAKNMWARIDDLGIAGYVDSVSQNGGGAVLENVRVSGHCRYPALAMDENTRYLDELESLFDEGEMVEGVCRNGLKLQDGQVAPLGVNLIDSMKVGTVEFWFRPNADFYDAPRTFIGNDGARIHFFYKNGELYFQKNHHNQHYYVKGSAKLKDDDWNLIAGQWGDGYMSVWLNDKMVARMEHDKGYAPATRGIPYENLVVIGYKSDCCMEGPGQYSAMTTSGSFDQFRISNIPRYKMTDDSVTVATNDVSDTADVDTVIADTMIADTAKIDTVDDTDTLICCVEPAIDTTVPDTIRIIDTMPLPLDVSLWSLLAAQGTRYFEKTTAPVASAAVQKCAAPALVMDDSTLYLDELETVYREGELVDGVCGKALSLKTGEVAPTGINLIDSMPAGTVEFWFRPNDDFSGVPARTLLGNDGARVHFFYKNGVLYFQKNHHNEHYFVKATVELKKDWNLIAGQWGDGSMSLWLNGEKVAGMVHSEGYEAADRSNPYENLFVIGYKSACCMEGPGQDTPMTTSGAYDQLRISNVVRYNSEDQSSVLEPDTTIAMDTVLTPVDTTATIDPITSSNSHDSAYVDSIDYTDTERYPLVVYDSLGRAAIFGIPFEDSKN